MTDFYCSLWEILTMSYLPDSYKVRSGPGGSTFRVEKKQDSSYQSVGAIFSERRSEPDTKGKFYPFEKNPSRQEPAILLK